MSINSEFMNERTVYIRTFGCQMNEYDTRRMYSILAEVGYSAADSAEDADLVLLNTCSVRDKAEHKAMSELGVLRLLKMRRPELVIGFGGCVAQQEGEKLLKKNPFLNFVFGTQSIHLLPEILHDIETKGKQVSRTELSHDLVVEELYPQKLSVNGVTAFISIMRGCNNFCSYCIVPYVRGREISRRPEDIVVEVEGLVEKGVRDVTLLGQNVNSYGVGLSPKMDFPDLLEQIHQIKGLKRIRFMTSHPKDFGKRLAHTMAQLPKVCDFLHLPVQSGSDRMLKAMRRKYTAEEYLEKINVVRDLIPGIALSTDIIVGFPGETEADFQKTMDLIERVRYENIFSFRYSHRKGTKASTFDDDVPEKEKLRRLSILQKKQRSIQQEISGKLLGSDVEVLVIGPSRRDPTRLSGRTSTNRIVNFTGSDARPGDLVWTRIDRVLQNSLSGDSTLIEEAEVSCL